MDIKEYQKLLAQMVKEITDKKSGFNKKMTDLENQTKKTNDIEGLKKLTKELIMTFAESQKQIVQFSKDLKKAKKGFKVGQSKVVLSSLLS